MRPHRTHSVWIRIPLLCALSLGAFVQCSDSSSDSGSSASDRFEACADGLTVADSQTGLLWEKKVGSAQGPTFRCAERARGCANSHNVRNVYYWSMQEIPPPFRTDFTDPDGNLFTDFLADLNDNAFAGHSDWRIPGIDEWRTIMVGPDAADGQSKTCNPPEPCVDPDFAAVAGPLGWSYYWSNDTDPDNEPPHNALAASFEQGTVISGQKDRVQLFARAVRDGSCS